MSKGVKYDEDKLRFDLIPAKPMQDLAYLYTKGARKYQDRNWENGIEWGRIYAAMQRHAYAFWGGEDFDPVDGQYHVCSIAWCAFAILEYYRTHPELDDRPTTKNGANIATVKSQRTSTKNKKDIKKKKTNKNKKNN